MMTSENPFENLADEGFKNGLKITLDLKLGTKKIAIEAGDIKALGIHRSVSF